MLGWILVMTKMVKFVTDVKYLEHKNFEVILCVLQHGLLLEGFVGLSYPSPTHARSWRWWGGIKGPRN